jgi:hypothetical protein
MRIDGAVMLRDPGPMLEALFANIRLPPFDDCESRLVVLNPAQIDEALDLATEEFGRYVPPSSVRHTLRFVSGSFSFGVTAGDMLIGAYLVSDNSLRMRMPRIPQIENRPALQGEALLVHSVARGLGFGQILRHMLPEVGRIVGADYVWGGALAELNNLNHWLRRRVLIRSTAGIHITLEPIAADLKEAFLPLAGEPLRDRWMGELGFNTIADDFFSQDWPSP